MLVRLDVSYIDSTNLDGSTASKESHKEDDAPDNDEEDRSVEEVITKEIQIVTEVKKWMKQTFLKVSLYQLQKTSFCDNHFVSIGTKPSSSDCLSPGRFFKLNFSVP